MGTKGVCAGQLYIVYGRNVDLKFKEGMEFKRAHLSKILFLPSFLVFILVLFPFSFATPSNPPPPRDFPPSFLPHFRTSAGVQVHPVRQGRGNNPLLVAQGAGEQRHAQRREPRARPPGQGDSPSHLWARITHPSSGQPSSWGQTTCTRPLDCSLWVKARGPPLSLFVTKTLSSGESCC